MTRPLSAVTLATGSALLLVACGGGSSGATKTASAVPTIAAATTSAAAVPQGSAASSGAAPTSAAPPPGPAGGAVPAGFQVSSVTFIGPDTGWVLGSPTTCATPPCTSVLRTRDGGATWVGIPAPKVPIDNEGDDASAVTHIRFADELDGYAFDPGLQVTHDGGATWHAITLPQVDVFDLAAANGVAYAVTNSQLYKSNVTGDTWTAVPGVTPASEEVGSIQLHGSAGVLLSYGGQSTIYVTSNGSTWSQVAIPCPSQGQGFQVGGVAVSTATAFDVVCDGTTSAGSAMATRQLYGTTDLGKTFTRLADPPQTGAFYGAADAGGGTAVVAVAGGVASQLQLTTDGAQHWSTALTAHESQAWTDVGFTDATHGVAVYDAAPTYSGIGTPTLFRSADGGKSWAQVTF